MKNYKCTEMKQKLLQSDSIIPKDEFRCREFEEGITFSAGNKDYNHILFILEGSILISCNEFYRREIVKNEFILIPISADTICKTTSDSKILFFSFNTFYDNNYLKELDTFCTSEEYNFSPLRIQNPLDQFIHLLSFYWEDNELNNNFLKRLKHKEFFIILKFFYTKKEIISFLYPLIGKSNEFRIKVLQNYRTINSITQFADLFKLEKKTFSQQFKDEFGTSPHQWLQQQKAKHISFSLVETQQPLETIRQENGFKFSSHFTRFCKEHLNSTPLQFRKKYKREIERVEASY